MGPQLDADLPVVEGARHGAIQTRHAIQKTPPQNIAVEEGNRRAPRQACEDPLQQTPKAPFATTQMIVTPVGQQCRFPIRIAVVPVEPCMKRSRLLVDHGICELTGRPPKFRLIMPLHCPHRVDIEIRKRRKRRAPPIEKRQLAVPRAITVPYAAEDRLAAEPEFEAWLLTWVPGQGTDWHDHGGSAGAFVTLRGQLTEEHATVSPFAAPRIVPRARELSAGTLRSFGSQHVHRVTNHGLEPAVSLHVYAPALTEMNAYVADGEQLRLVTSQLVGVDW